MMYDSEFGEIGLWLEEDSKLRRKSEEQIRRYLIN